MGLAILTDKSLQIYHNTMVGFCFVANWFQRNKIELFLSQAGWFCGFSYNAKLSEAHFFN